MNKSDRIVISLIVVLLLGLIFASKFIDGIGLKTLEEAKAYDGLSLICVPVYAGDDELGGMGVFGRWNVGNWCEDVQALRHKLGV